jgi:L-ascorbate metabolism protein UlaG (beta-lactamase superfamily)
VDVVNELEITKAHHASVLVRSPGAQVLIDPGALGPPPSLESVDAILLTHDHADHADPDLLREAAAAGIDVWSPPDALDRLGLAGERVRAAHAGSRLTVGDLDVMVTGDRHAEVHPELDGPMNRAYVLDGRVLVTGDAHPAPPVPVDVLVTPVDAPWLRATDLIRYTRTVRPSLVVGVHDGLLNDDGLQVAHAVLESLTREGADAVVLPGSGDTVRV